MGNFCGNKGLPKKVKRGKRKRNNKQGKEKGKETTNKEKNKEKALLHLNVTLMLVWNFVLKICKVLMKLDMRDMFTRSHNIG